MLSERSEESNGRTARGDEFRPSVPQISLPKGGGAIRGIGEKFAANPVTGTSSLTVPIFISPGRSRFGPQLSLSYDSGAGNGPFGFGWSLALPSLTRRTDKGLPQYADVEESDTFILSGRECSHDAQTSRCRPHSAAGIELGERHDAGNRARKREWARYPG